MTPQIGSFGLGFGLAFVLEDMFSQTAAEIERKLGQLDGVTETVAARVDRSLNQMKLGFAAMGVGIATLLPFGWGVKIAGEMEQVQISFEVMLKSADRAKTLIAELRQFADVTPFETKEVISAGRNLVAFGLGADKVVSTLEQLGNVASGVNMPIGELAEIFGKNLQQPNLQTRDIWQMTNRGIPIIKALAEVMGVADTAVMQLVEDAKVGVPEMMEAFRRMSAEGGQFAGLMDRQSQSWQGLVSTFKSYVDYVGQALGDAILPDLKAAVKWMGELMKKFADFMNTPLGKTIARIVFWFGVVLTVGGAVIGMIGLMKYSVILLASAFTGATKAMILTTIAQHGVIAGFRAMAVAAWASLGPYVAILVPILLLVKAWTSFTKVMEGTEKPAKGLMGWFQKLGGILHGVVEIFKSWDGKNFTLSEKLASGLEKMGILDTVIAIGTWIIRIIEFFKGMWAGIKEGLKAVWAVLKPIFNAIEEALASIGFSVGKNQSEISKWAEIGKYVGYVIVGALVLIGIQMSILAIQTIVALWPVILIILAVVAVLWVLWEVAGVIAEAMTWLCEKVAEGWQWLKDQIQAFVDWFLGIPERAYQFGVDFVNSLVDGLLSAWDTVKGWVTDAFDWLWPDDEINVNRNFRSTSLVGVSTPVQQIATQKASMVAERGSAGGKDGADSKRPIHLHNYLDGKEIANNVVDRMDEGAGRK